RVQSSPGPWAAAGWHVLRCQPCATDGLHLAPAGADPAYHPPVTNIDGQGIPKDGVHCRLRKSGPAIGIDANLLENTRDAPTRFGLQVRKHQPHQPHGLGMILHTGPTEEFTIEKHFRQLGRILGHLSTTPVALGPDLGCEFFEFAVFPETTDQRAPWKRLDSS